MGCSTSRLEDEEAVQLCKDRKRFIKQAVEQRTKFASGHLAYIQSLKRVSAALRDYVDGDEPREFSLDSLITPPFTPVKKTSPSFISITPKSLPRAVIQPAPNSTLKVNYLRSGGNQTVAVEERPQSPETVRIEAYSPMHHQYGWDGYFGGQPWQMNSSFFAYSPSPGRSNIPPRSPQTSQWDGFWNPFSSLDYYGYPTRSSLDQMVMDDDVRGLRRVREEEGIPELEDETEEEEISRKGNATQEQSKVDVKCSREEVVVEDIDEDEEDEEEEDDDDDEETDCECDCECESGHEIRGLQSQGSAKVELSRAQSSRQVGGQNREMAVGRREGTKETPAFTVYVNRRPTSMGEVIKDLEEQFVIACDSAKEVSTLLESRKAQYSTASNELSAMKLLNPVALIRSASSRSSSSRFLLSSSSSRGDGFESNGDLSDESCMFSGHQSTLDRLYIWEKKLYEEIKSGEKIRIAYEKKQMQLRNQDVKGEDPSVVDKTRVAIRDLYTQLQVSIHSAEAVSRRIEALRDEELQPQLLELVQGLARMWKVMAECHRSQKQTLDEAKLLLAGTPSKRRHSSISAPDPQRLARSASNLETELRNWRATFEAWITSQRSYLHALTGWLLRCVRSDSDTSKHLVSPRRSNGTYPIFGICIQWSRLLDAVQEIPVLDGLDFFAAGMGSLYAQQLSSGSKRYGNEYESNMEIVAAGQVEEVMTAEKMAEVGIRVLCAGMSVAVSSLAEFAGSSSDGYAELISQWKDAKWRPSLTR